MYSEGGCLPPRRLILAIAAITGMPFAALLWLGWQLFDQDRVVQRQHAQERLESAGDLAVAAVDRAISSTERALEAGRNEWPDGAVAVTIQGGRVEPFPRQRVAYLPQPQKLREAPDTVFAEGDDFEFRQHDAKSAIRFLTTLSNARDPAVRAGAMLRLARNLSAIGRTEDALAVYRDMSEIDGAAVGAVPAALVARYARCALLAGAGRTDQLRNEATDLAQDLHAARWPLTAPVYWLYVADAMRWSGKPAGVSLTSEALAAGVAALSDRRQKMDGRFGRDTLAVGSEKLTVLWRRSDESLRALLVSKPFIETEWLAAARIVEKQQHVRIQVRERGTPLHGEVGDGRPQFVVREASATSLPWSVLISTDKSVRDDGSFAQRRRLMLAGFVLVLCMTLASSYMLLRAVSREMAVARMKSEFVSTVSHEFRTPLTALRQFTDLLLDDTEMTNERRRLCYEAQARATGRLTRLVESLLDFGRIESGRRTYEFAARDCAELVRETVEEFRSGQQGNCCPIAFRADGPAPANVDAEALSRALWNLLDNAVKYSLETAPIEVETASRNGSVSIAVRDRGMGIAPHERASIFARFHRGQEARRSGIQGTGLGLAIVEQVARAHRGRVQVDSEPGRGSTFTILLPRSE